MIYLDNAATSWPKPAGCAEAAAQALTRPLGNPGRTSHGAGISADRILFELRESLAEFLHIRSSEQIILCSGATEALNTVLFGRLRKGGKVLCSSMEHNAVMRPLRFLEAHNGLSVRHFPSDEQTGYPDLKAFEATLDDDPPDLLVMTAASNVNGVIFPLEEMTAAARKRGVPVCIDGAQGVGELKLKPEDWNVDYLCFAGHKGLLGPAGTGGLYIREPETIPPLILGGTGSRSREETQPGEMPDRFESGTPNIPGYAGLLASLEYLEENPALRQTADERFGRLCRGLRQLEGLRIIGHPESAEEAGIRYTSVLSVLPDKGSLTEMTAFLNDRNIAVRSGLQCAPAAHKTLNSFSEGGTLRLSPGAFTTDDEIEETIRTIEEYLCRTPKN